MAQGILGYMSSTEQTSPCARAPAKRPRVECLQAALAHCSESAVWRMQSLLQGREVKQRSGAFKRQTNAALAPYRNCLVDLEMPALEGPPVHFAMANVKALLRLLSEECPSFQRWLQQQKQPLQCIIAHDETTAGNVLATQARQKVMSVDLSFTGLSDMQSSALAWVPLACVSSEDVGRTRGGMSAITAEICREWQRQCLEDMFPVGNVSVSLHFAIFVADHDAQRDTFCAKGSAGLRCCMFCTCVSKSSKAAQLDAGFHSIEEHRLDAFESIDPKELETLIVHYMTHQEGYTKGQLLTIEKALGFHVTNTDGNIWSCEVARKVLPVNKVMNDSTHCYYSNGVAACEINLIVGALETKQGVTLHAIQQTVIESAFKRPLGSAAKGENAWWIQRLFHHAFYTGTMFKGSASQCQALIPLFRFLIAQLWCHMPALEKEIKSFLALCRCCETLRHIAKTRAWQKLAFEQQEHHRLFQAAYPGSMRPKHHHRHHLSGQYESLGYVANCWGVESKHKDYKSIYADHFKQFLGDPTFSARLLPRLLLRHVDVLNERPILVDQPFDLQSAFSAEEVFAATGILGARIANRCRLPLAELREGDYLFWNGFQAGGRCCFFLCQENNEDLFVFMEHMKLQADSEDHKVFCRSNARGFVRFASLTSAALASWISEADASTVVCLP